jgi:predicted nucleic acid-binding protein
MCAAVVDASALAAIVFDEPEAAPVVASVRGLLLAPTLIRYELASVCLTKIVRHPRQAETIVSRYREVERLAIELVEPDFGVLAELGHRWHLSVYDAAYLQVALASDADLVTLDARLAAAWDASRSN